MSLPLIFGSCFILLAAPPRCLMRRAWPAKMPRCHVDSVLGKARVHVAALLWYWDDVVPVHVHGSPDHVLRFVVLISPHLVCSIECKNAYVKEHVLKRSTKRLRNAPFAILHVYMSCLQAQERGLMHKKKQPLASGNGFPTCGYPVSRNTSRNDQRTLDPYNCL
jgi:hypothetical protein